MEHATALALVHKGWGLLLDSRHDIANGHRALIQFADEEAPRWIPYTLLARHRRDLLSTKRQLHTS